MTPRTWQQNKITPAHLRRQALIYIRQSSPQQVRSHQESRERQYALVERAVALGWTPETIDTIDDDQGRSGTSAVHRPGFKKLVADISAGQVGIVLALEASRLARSSADWHRLIEICSITRTLLADDGAVYDPREPNDRLLLGVKRSSSRCGVVSMRDAGIKHVAAPSCARCLLGMSRRRTARSIKTQTGKSKAVLRMSFACSRACGWHAKSWSSCALRT